jgi:hypothetical protein
MDEDTFEASEKARAQEYARQQAAHAVLMAALAWAKQLPVGPGAFFRTVTLTPELAPLYDAVRAYRLAADASFPTTCDPERHMHLFTSFGKSSNVCKCGDQIADGISISKNPTAPAAAKT